MNNPFEESLYVLAERLHQPVYKIRHEMPLSEFLGWLRFYQNKDKPKPVEITDMKPDQLAEMFNK